MAQTTIHDVIVVGAGPAGLITALALGSRDLDVALIGPPARTADERAAALFGGSITLLERLGIMAQLRPAAAPLTGIRLIDATNSVLRAPEIVFRSAELGLPQFGYAIANRALTESLENCVRQTGIKRIALAVTAIHRSDDLISVQTSDGAIWQSQLLAAADGRNSICRKAAAIDITTRQLPQKAVVAHFHHTRLNDGISTEWHRPNGPLTIVPALGQGASLVWVESPDEADRLVSLPNEAFCKELSSATGRALGKLTNMSDRQAFPLSHLQASPLAARRTVLIGEAGHVIPPIGAQGLNLSFRDAATLADLAEAARSRTQDIGAETLLENYNQRRSVDITTRQRGVGLLNQSLLWSVLPPVHIGRGIGLTALRHWPWLRRKAMQIGLMPGEDLPELMQTAGEAEKPLQTEA